MARWCKGLEDARGRGFGVVVFFFLGGVGGFLE